MIHPTAKMSEQVITKCK